MSADPIRTTAVQPYDVRLHYAWTSDAWARLARRFAFDSTDAPEAWGQTRRTWDAKTQRTHILIWVDRANPAHTDPVVHLGTIVHEGYHAAGGILDGVGQSFDGSSEAAAYLVDWVVQWLIRNTPHLTVAQTPTPSEDSPA